MTPLQKRDYLTGALAAREFLRRMQSELRVHRQFLPQTLRWSLRARSGCMCPNTAPGFSTRSGRIC